MRLRLVRLWVGLQQTGTMGWRQKSTYIQPSSSIRSDPYNNELKELLGANTNEYFKASSVLGKLAWRLYDETKAAFAEVLEANAETKAAVAKVLEANAETKAAVAKETEARIKVIELTRDLVDANMETLRLKGLLDVRGMLVG